MRSRTRHLPATRSRDAARRARWPSIATLVAMALCLAGCSHRRSPPSDPFAGYAALEVRDFFAPSHHRPWSADFAVLPYVEIQGHYATVRNVRNFVYQSDRDYVVRFENRVYDLREVETIDFLVVPFKNTPSLAHTMLSFGFADGEYLGVSVEARLEEGEEYSPVAGALRQYELMYIVADERDLVARRTRHRDVDVLLYPTIATPEQSRLLFLDVCHRINELARQPEFYDTLTNNCTTNIVRHINQLRPGRVPLDIRVLLPGFSDRAAFELGLIDSTGSFEQTRRRARVNAIANRSLEAGDFSQRIREQVIQLSRRSGTPQRSLGLR